MEFHSCPRNHAREVPVAAGSVLCAGCVEQLERNLRTLPGLHQEGLHHILSTSRRRNPTKVSGSRRRDHLNISALDARNNILAILESWSGFVVEKLGAAAPGRSVPHLACFLILNLEWLTTQPPAAEFADEVESLQVESLRAIDPDSDDEHAPVIACVMDDCPGTINASPRNARTPGRGSISCSSGHSWEMRELLTIRHLMDRQRKDAA
ncbi:MULTISPECIES: hypothetical protein [Streptomyces]|uniref:hypothetical protein n=1 Tax=Streptomyces TaxID=1883 RepID=UPI0006E18BD6|nr:MULTISPECIES: hypothetical protein [Streptomyces]